MQQPVTVIVVGSINADLVVRVPALPRPGQTLAGSAFETLQGGKGANQAVAAAAVGARTVLVAAVGDDAYGMAALADLRERGVDTSFVTVGGEPTGVAVIQLDDAGENTIVVVPGANAALEPSFVDDAFAALAASGTGDAVVVANLEVPVATVQRAAELAEQRGWAFVLNPAPAQSLPAELLRRVTVATPNETEADALGSAQALVGAGVRAVVVTRGGEGVDIVTGDESLHVPACEARVVDTVGAGDAFTAALAVALGRGMPLESSAAWAAAVGAIAVETLGARIPRLSDERIAARVPAAS